jgi:glycosyltransferase involved in cell wall biosynthesis
VKVVVVHGRYRSTAPSGENHVVDQERAALTGAGHCVSTFERHSDDIAGWPLHRKAGLPLRSIRDQEARRDLARHLERERPDVVHVHNTFPLLSPSVLRACADVGVPVVATIHNYKLLCASGDFFRDGRPCHDCARGRGAPGLVHGCYRGSRLATAPVVLGSVANRDEWRRLVSAYVFISGAQRDLMAPLDLPSDRVFVKHNFVPEPGGVTGRRERTVTYVGRLDAAKGVPLLMAAWDSFRRLHPESTLRLTIAGGGPLDEQVRAWARAHPSVDVLGLVAREEVWPLLARSIAVLVPSQWEETFGLVAVEAMAASVAPIAPASGSFPELVDDGVDGRLFPPGSAEGLALAIADADAHPGSYLEMGRRGRRTYERRFTRERGLDRLVEIYRFATTHPVVQDR